MTCDPDNDVEYRIGMLQHTLDSVLEHLHNAANQGQELNYISIVQLLGSRRALETLLARLGIDADTQGWLSSDRRDGGPQDHSDH